MVTQYTLKNGNEAGKGNTFIESEIFANAKREPLPYVERSFSAIALDNQKNAIAAKAKKDKSQADFRTAKEKKQAENFNRNPFSRIARAVIYRLENPKLKASQRDATPRRMRGSNGKKSVIGGYTPADGKKSVSFNGFDKARLSEIDRDEVLNAVSLALSLESLEPKQLAFALGLSFKKERGEAPALQGRESAELKQHGECFPCRVMLNLVKLNLSHWKQCFSAARLTLGIDKTHTRESLIESIHGLEADIKDASSVNLIALEMEKDREARERQTVADKARELNRALCAAFAFEIRDGARQARGNFKAHLKYARRAIKAAIGEGHAKETMHRTAAHKASERFQSYLAIGKRELARLQWIAEMETVSSAQ